METINHYIGNQITEELINRNKEKYNPDRRDNILLNASIRRLLDNMDEATSDAVLGYAEQSAETLVDSDYAQKKSRVIAHEIKNQLSICDLYTEIIRKNSENGNVEGIPNAIKAINKALKMANNSLLALKSNDSTELKNISLKDIIIGNQKVKLISKVFKNAKKELD